MKPENLKLLKRWSNLCKVALISVLVLVLFGAVARISAELKVVELFILLMAVVGCWTSIEKVLKSESEQA